MTIAEFVFSLYANVVVVLKGAANHVDPDQYVGFLVESDGSGDSTFDYMTVFLSTKGNVGNPQNISHISLYGQGTPSISDVPLPAAAWLMLAGLLSLFGLRRRQV